MRSPSPPPSMRCVDAMEGALALELGRRVRLGRRPPPTYQRRMSGSRFLRHRPTVAGMITILSTVDSILGFRLVAAPPWNSSSSRCDIR
jgi:hypothetical protein